MNKYGFTDEEWNETLTILKQCPEIEKTVLFDSRAKNTFKLMIGEIRVEPYAKESAL